METNEKKEPKELDYVNYTSYQILSTTFYNFLDERRKRIKCNEDNCNHDTFVEDPYLEIGVKCTKCQQKYRAIPIKLPKHEKKIGKVNVKYIWKTLGDQIRVKLCVINKRRKINE